MTDQIDYYFTTISPFAFLGHKALMDISQRHNKPVKFKPFNIFSVWEQSGALPPKDRPPVRQRYRLIELQRAGIIRNTTINPKPAHFPTDPTLADCCICALQALGEDPSEFAYQVGRAVWERDLQINDESVLSELLADSGHNAKKVIDHAHTEDIQSERVYNTDAAIKADAIGAPAYVYKGEVFWGQDRLEYLEQMISSGRSCFSSDF
ncbi:MAG: 2-hydroxychromene-2-carboxylate isomerase [Pseudomonadota bacterium]